MDHYDYWNQTNLPSKFKKEAQERSEKLDYQIEQIADGQILSGLSDIIGDEAEYYTGDSYQEHVEHVHNNFMSARIWLADWIAYELISLLAKTSMTVLTVWFLTSSMVLLAFKPRSSESLLCAALCFSAVTISIVIGGSIGLAYGSQWGFLGQILCSFAGFITLLVLTSILLAVQGGIPNPKASTN